MMLPLWIVIASCTACFVVGAFIATLAARGKPPAEPSCMTVSQRRQMADLSFDREAWRDHVIEPEAPRQRLRVVRDNDKPPEAA